MGKIFNNREKNKKTNKKTNKNKSKYIVLLILMLISVVSISYAAATIELKGEKKYSLTIGTLDFKIDNEQNSIRLMNAYPMSDEEGQALRPYTFTVTNTGTINEYYKVSLITDTKGQADCEGCTFLAPSKLRYSLTVDGVVGEAKTVSDQTVLELGELTANQTKNYELRLWLNSEATIEEENKYYYGKIKVEASQEEFKDNGVEDNKPYVNWKVEDGYSETIDLGDGEYLVKISDEIITTKNMLGLYGYMMANDSLLSCGEDCIMEEKITQEMIDSSVEIDETTGTMSLGYLIFVPETFTQDGMTVSAGVWTFAAKESEESDNLIPILIALRIGPPPSIDWKVEDGYLETILIGDNTYFVKISDEIITTKNILGSYIYLELNDSINNCGENCVGEMKITQEIIDSAFSVDKTTGITSIGEFLISVPNTISEDGMTLSAGSWTVAIKTSDSDNLVPTINTLIIDPPPSIDWSVEDGYTETIDTGDGGYLVKISDEIVTTENILGLYEYMEANDSLLSCGESCIMEGTITQEMVDNSIYVDEATGILIFSDVLIFAPETVTFNGLTITAGVWTVAAKTSDSDNLVPTINVFKLK